MGFLVPPVRSPFFFFFIKTKFLFQETSSFLSAPGFTNTSLGSCVCRVPSQPRSFEHDASFFFFTRGGLVPALHLYKLAREKGARGAAGCRPKQTAGFCHTLRTAGGPPTMETSSKPELRLYKWFLYMKHNEPTTKSKSIGTFV